jgi:hypothetical protein
VVVLLAVAGLVVFGLGSSSAFAASLVMHGDQVTTDDGTINELTVDASGEVRYDGAEHQPGETEVELQVKNPDGSWETIATQTETLSGLAGEWTYSFSDVSVVQTDYEKSDFKPSGDGESLETEIQFRLAVTADGNLDGSDNRENTEFTSDTATATVDVTNEANHNSAGGSGDVDADGSNSQPADNQQ